MAVPPDPQHPGAPDGTSLRTLFDFLPIGAYRSRPDGTLVWANPALARINGFHAVDELQAVVHDIGREWYVDPGRRQRLRELLERDGQVRAFISEVVRYGTGERIWVSENAHVVTGGDGRVEFYEGTVEDITVRVQALAHMQRSEHQLRQIAEHIPGMVYRVHYPLDGSRQYRYTFVSGGVRQLYGVDPEAVLGDPMLLRSFRHPDDVLRVDDEVREAIDQGRPLTVDYRIVVGGRQRWVQMSSSASLTEGNERVRVGVMLDVSELRQAEAMRSDRDRAESARLQMTQFLSRVSHELRTPLNAILGFAQLIEMEADTPDAQRQWTRTLIDSGRHLLDMVNDVLDLTGAQSGQMTFELRAVDLADALREAWAMVASDAEKRGLRFGGLPAANRVTVQSDRRRLVQVLANLLSNAVKYNRAGGPVDLRLRVLPGMVEVDVVDGGAGMEPDQLARLFRPFDRLGAQHGTVQGSGLGLALSRQLAEAMGGSISAASVPGQGSSFTLRLPLDGAPTRART